MVVPSTGCRRRDLPAFTATGVCSVCEAPVPSLLDMMRLPSCDRLD